MRRTSYIVAGIGILITTGVTLSKQPEKQQIHSAAIPSKEIIQSDFVVLEVPFIWEVPDGLWVKPWNNACEEASLSMVEQYYLGNRTVSIGSTQSKKLMQPLFAWENKMFGSNSDTDAARTARMFNEYSSVDVMVQFNPAIEDIKTQLRNGNPVVSLHYGYALKNPKHRFRRGGSSYHMMVLVGFDEKKKEFIVNDPELKDGRQIRYSYARIMESLHNFNHVTKKANGTPVVLFTRPKQLVKTDSDPAVFLIRAGTRYHIANPTVLERHRITLQLLTTVKESWLFSLKEGPVIRQ